MAVLVLVVAWLPGLWCVLLVESEVVSGAVLESAAEAARAAGARQSGEGVAVWVCGPEVVGPGFDLAFGLFEGVMLIASVLSRRFSGLLKRLAVGCWMVLLFRCGSLWSVVS